MVRLIDAVEQPGQHAADYGGRGVGKTSLAKVMVKTFSLGTTPIVSLHYTCSATDTFESVWRSVFDDLLVTLRTLGFGFAAQATFTPVPSTQVLPDLDHDMTPDVVRRALYSLTATAALVIFIDEFDRLQDAQKGGFADTTKVLSDQLVPATLVLVGVADDIDGLVCSRFSILITGPRQATAKRFTRKSCLRAPSQSAERRGHLARPTCAMNCTESLALFVIFLPSRST